MTYNDAIPQGPDYLSDSQPEILENFSQLNAVFNENHVKFNDVTVSDRGKHTNVHLIEQADSPGTAANEMALYTKETDGVSELFLQREGLAAAGDDIQMSVGTPLVGGNGYTFLPGGIIFQWCSGLAAPGAGGVIPYTMPFPNNVFGATLGGRSSGPQDFVMLVPNLVNVTVICEGGSQLCYLFAIGN